MKNFPYITILVSIGMVVGFFFDPFYLSKNSGPEDYFLYIFSHGHWVHLLANLITFTSFGWIIEKKMIGKYQYASLVLFGSLVPGIVHVLLHDTAIIGVSGTAMALLTFYALLRPEYKMLYFVKAKHMIIAIIAASIYGFLTDKEVSIAHAAHLTGAVIGYIHFQLFRDYARARMKKRFMNYLKRNGH